MKTTKKPSYKQLATAVKLQSAAAINYRQEIGELREIQGLVAAQRDGALKNRDLLMHYLEMARFRLETATSELQQRRMAIDAQRKQIDDLFQTVNELVEKNNELQAKNLRLRKYIDVLITSLGTAQGQPIAA